jgi:hypothetical protein
MLKSRVIITLLLFAVGMLAVPTRPVVAQYGHWQHRWQSRLARHPVRFRQESPWRRWGPARQTSSHSMQSSHGCGGCFEAPHQPSSIGAYNPGNTPGMRVMNASSSRPNGGYPSMNGGAYGTPGYSSQGAGSSYQGSSSSYQGGSPSYQSAGSSSRNTDSSGATGYQPSETRYICVVAGMGYCGLSGRPNISSGSRCHCGEASGLTR